MGSVVRSSSVCVAGGLHGLSLRLPWGWMLAWVALVPLLRIAAAGERNRTIAATIAYALILGQADVTPWLVPAIGRYFAPRTRVRGRHRCGRHDRARGGVRRAARRGAGRAPTRSSAARDRLVCRDLEPLGVAPNGRAALSRLLHVRGLAGRRAALLQLASVAGIAAVTALVVAGNAALAAVADPRLPRARAALVRSRGGGAARRRRRGVGKLAHPSRARFASSAGGGLGAAGRRRARVRRPRARWHATSPRRRGRSLRRRAS